MEHEIRGRRRAARAGGVVRARRVRLRGERVHGRPRGLAARSTPTKRGALWPPDATPSRRPPSRTACASLTAPMPQAKSVACFVMLAAGSRYETRETNGIAHFAEHMFFKGTERRPTARDIAGEIDSIGGEFNAFTGKEYTGYYVKCAAEHRDTALDVLVDMLRHSKFDAEEIEREKGVIVEEMNMYFDTPRDYVDGVYDELLYGDQPLGWDIIGTKETVRAATRETFLDYLDRWYRAPRMVAGIGGAVGDDAVERLGSLLGDVPDGATGAPARVDAGAERAAGQAPHEAVRPGAPPRSACTATRSTTPTATRSRSSRRCSAAACRRASSPRCASGAASPTTSTATTRATRTRARCSPRAASTSSGSTRPSRRSSREFGRIAARAGRGRRAREGAQLRQGPPRALARGPEGDDHVRPARRGARGPRARARRGARRPRRASRSRTSSASRRTSSATIGSTSR